MEEVAEETADEKQEMPKSLAVGQRKSAGAGSDGLDGPRSWPMSRRIAITALTALSTMVVTFASAIFTSAIPALVHNDGVSREVGTLSISLFVLGFALGPVFWVPFSELKGRYMPFMSSLLGFTIASTLTGATDNFATILVFRFLAGFFGAGPLTLVGPIYADMFSGPALGISMVSFAFVVFLGPVLSQPVGGFIVRNQELGWKWTEYFCGIMGAGTLVPITFTLKETHAATLLARETKRIHKKQGEHGDYSFDRHPRANWRGVGISYITRPFKLLAFDPIVLLMCLFGSYVYGLLYLFLFGYPIVFQKVHGMEPGISGLPNIGLAVGQMFAVAAILGTQVWLMKKAQQGTITIMPEHQLLVAIPGAVAFAAGVFWFGWSGYDRNIHWIVPTLSGLLSGFGLLTTFVPSISYLTQARPESFAAAVAAHTMLRSLAAAGFPMFAGPMYNGMGVQWASTLLACLALLMIPIPIALYIYGSRIRSKGEKHAPREQLDVRV